MTKKSHLKHRWISSQLSLLAFFYIQIESFTGCRFPSFFYLCSEVLSLVRILINSKPAQVIMAMIIVLNFFTAQARGITMGLKPFWKSQLNWKLPCSNIFTRYFSKRLVFFSSNASTVKLQVLKVIKSRKQFMVSSIHPKNE